MAVGGGVSKSRGGRKNVVTAERWRKKATVNGEGE
jgi:hypothetical protein